MKFLNYSDVKRFADIAVSIFLLIPSIPVLSICIFLIYLESGAPVFFTQERIGYQGFPFKIFKLRTMIYKPNREIDTSKEILQGHSEVTKLGFFLRRFKIDELPQLFNILKGDMSIVGPRPIIIEFLDKLDENGENRLKVRPGITGLAQVNGNIYLSWPERWKFDAEYVKKQGFLLDFNILLKTLFVVIRGEHKFKK